MKVNKLTSLNLFCCFVWRFVFLPYRYGTGCFLLYNTGSEIVKSHSGLLTTVAYKLGKDSPPVYALEVGALLFILLESEETLVKCCSKMGQATAVNINSELEC